MITSVILFAMITSVFPVRAGLRHLQTLAMPVESGATYEVTVDAFLPNSDVTNDYAVAACGFSFSDNEIEVQADDTLVAAALKRDDYKVMEFLFPDCAMIEDDKHRWVFQVKVPAPATIMRVECKPWNRLSRAQFKPIRISKVSGSAASFAAGVKARRNFRLIDGADSLTVTGSALSRCSGRIRVEIETWQKNGAEKLVLAECPICLNGTFSTIVPLPEGTYGGRWTINAEAEKGGETTPQKFSELNVYPSFRPRRLENVETPERLVVDVQGCAAVDVVLALSSTDEEMEDSPKAVIVRAKFVDRHGVEMPVDELPLSPKWGRYWYCRAGYGTHVTRKVIKIPSEACKLDLAVSKFWQKSDVALDHYRAIRRFATNPTLAYDIEDCKTRVVEWVGGEMELERILNRSEQPKPFVSLCESIMGRKCTAASSPRSIVFTSFNDVANIGENINWTEDPFDNMTWQMNFSTGYWIPFTGLRADDYYGHVKGYWRSFFKLNQWPAAANKMVYVDHASAARIEAMLMTLFGNQPNDGCAANIPCLMGEIRNDREFLYEMLNQLRVDVELIYHHLNSRIYKIHNHNLIMAQVLLEFSQCFLGSEFARRYAEMALYKINEHLNLMFEPDGFIREQSTKYHHWMTLHFAELYRYFKQAGIGCDAEMDSFKAKLARLFVVDMQLAMPDGLAAPMGDGAPPPITADDLRMLKMLPDIYEDVKSQQGKGQPRFVYLPESGLIVVRDAENLRYLLIDLSSQVQEHGHKDLGSWQYFAHGVRWVQDVGGPYKYGTAICRSFAGSSSHTVVGLKNRAQTSGSAFDINVSEGEEVWYVEAKDNVYGAKYGHTKRFTILKDVSAFRVEDVFAVKDIQTPSSYVGRLTTGFGVCCENTSEGWNLSKSGRVLNVCVESAGSFKLTTEERDMSVRMQELLKVKSPQYEFSGVPTARASVLISEDSLAADRLRDEEKRRVSGVE